MTFTGQLTDFPTPREAPRDIVRALRDVDETAELLYLGEGKWVLGRVRPTPERFEGGKRLLRQAWELAQKGGMTEERWYKRIRSARLTMQGFAKFGMYEFKGDPDWRIVRDFREALWWFRNDKWSDEFNKRADEADFGASRAAMKDLLDDARAREAARIMRMPVSVSVPSKPESMRAA